MFLMRAGTRACASYYYGGDHDSGMWKILGKDAIYLDIPLVWKQRMLELAGEGEKEDKFREIVG